MSKTKLPFIRTGNQDRSPTAEGLFRCLQDYEDRSAGTSTFAVQRVTQELFDWADKIFVMSELEDRHLSFLEANFKLARTLYQRHDTWYEFLLKQFNPDNLDYGAWLEQRRHAFLDARLRNPYFGFSFGVTAVLLLMTAVCTKLWIDHRRAM